MVKPVVLLSIPGLREKDVARMKHLRELMAGGEIADLVPSFPCVTCPVQANMTTGDLPDAHGVVANGFYWRERRQVEMWTSPNDCIARPQLWDLLYHHESGLHSAVWFPLHARGCEAEYVCTPAPVHNPDGTESLWCYTRPREHYGVLRDALGHFPLQHFWGPMANVKSTAWIVESAILAAKAWQPDFFYAYLPNLDYDPQRHGPDSTQADYAVVDLDRLVGRLARAFREAYDEEPLWLAAGEYAINAVTHVSYPNRVLREGGLLAVRDGDDGEQLDLERSRAWALVDHQFSHVLCSRETKTRFGAWPTFFTTGRGSPRCSSASSARGTIWITREAAKRFSSPPRRAGKPTTGGSPTSERRGLHAPSTFIASRVMIPWSCLSTLRPRRSPWTPRWCAARTVRRPKTRASTR